MSPANTRKREKLEVGSSILPVLPFTIMSMMERGRLEYDGYEETTEALRRMRPAIQRGKEYRRELSNSPPRLTQAALDAVRIDKNNFPHGKPSTAPATGQRQVYTGRDVKDRETLDVDVDIFSSANKSKGEKKKSKRPSTATGTIRRPGYVGISAITRESSQRPKWGSRRGKFQPRFDKVPELDENGMTVSSKLPSGDKKKLLGTLYRLHCAYSIYNRQTQLFTCPLPKVL